MSIIHATLLSVLAAVSIGSGADAAPQDDAEHFDRVVAPLLAQRCMSCHSGAKPKGKLDLSRRSSVFPKGEHDALIEAGNPQSSLLWELVEDDEMPPEHPLPAAEKIILHDWISAGAVWGASPIDPFRYSSTSRAGYDWWSLQPLAAVEPPLLAADGESTNAIDNFIVARLRERSLQPAPRADARTLVRRLYVDLIGLPAPLDVIDAFDQDPSPERWARMVDDLLESKHYGERWARHWLDIARFGETGGYEYNTPRESAWHYRDWLIRAFNQDLPYDEFARMQLAGDILEPDTVAGAAAVGFLVAGVHNEVLGKSPAMKQSARQDELEEIVGTVAQAFLGMTVNCARCHDHKFDPISTREYYQFIAALDGIQHGTRDLNPKPELTRELAELRRAKGALQSQLIESIASRNGVLSTSANRIELKAPIAANQEGVRYELSLRLAPTVWASPAQVTKAGDGIAVRLIKGDNQVLATHVMEAPPWNGGRGATAFKARSFTYEGDGSGPVRLQLEPRPLGSERFGGAVDDLSILVDGETIFSEDFENLEHSQPPGIQAETGAKVFYSASSKTWKHSGKHAIHAVEHAPGNVAVQLFGGSPEKATPQAETSRERELQSQIVQLGQEIKARQGLAATKVFSVRPKQPGVMRIHQRGNVSSLGAEVAPGGLGAIREHSPAFGIDKTASDAERRGKLAEWISAPDNSLFHRVIVNRVWHYHFGRGLVDSPNDFGFNGGLPSHPLLLDWLAVWFKENGYSLKKLHRLILTSATYQQSSSVSSNATYAAAVAIDKGNSLLWRQNPRRISAEVLRDSLLAIAGVLNPQFFGPGYRDVRIDRVPPAYYYIAIDPIGPQFNRRTIYRWQARGQRSALLDTFDCPDPCTTAPRRSVTTTASQALAQWNHPFVLRMCARLAERITQEVGADVADQVQRAWRLVLGRAPDDDEAAAHVQLVEKHGLHVLARILFNCNETIWIE